MATRVAFTELRRRAERETKHAAFQQAQMDALARFPYRDAHASATELEKVLTELHAAIESELTDRQRVATLALLRGVPTIEIAEQLDSNQNAVYKLVHDARLRLRKALERQGITAELLAELNEGGAQ